LIGWLCFSEPYQPVSIALLIDTRESIATNAVLNERQWRRGMGLIGVLKSLNVENMSDAEKADMKKKLLAHKQELKNTSKLIDGHLKKLTAKKKKKKAKK
jgi:hypothetical protein